MCSTEAESWYQVDENFFHNVWYLIDTVTCYLYISFFFCYFIFTLLHYSCCLLLHILVLLYCLIWSIWYLYIIIEHKLDLPSAWRWRQRLSWIFFTPDWFERGSLEHYLIINRNIFGMLPILNFSKKNKQNYISLFGPSTL